MVIQTETTLAINGGRVVGGGPRAESTLFVSGGQVTAVAGPVDSRFNAEGLWVCPGLIDLQINGGFGIDLVAEPERVWELGELLPMHGVTAFAPTIISSPPAVVERAMDALRARPAGYGGAEPLGVHAEGPMLNRGRAGAHQVRRLRRPSLELIEDWGPDRNLALVTLAPELPGALRVASELVRRGVTVSAGHSDATAAEAAAAIDAGVSAVTHLFNAMASFGHRRPGLVGVALSDPALNVGLIVDGVHVDPVAVRVAWHAKGGTGVFLVTDAVAAMGCDPGRHLLGSDGVTSDGAAVRNDDGVLAGSLLTMDRAIRNLVKFTGCGVPEAVAAASSMPARVVGRHDRGHLGAGAVADLTLFDDDLRVAATVCRGRLTYVAETARHRLSGSAVV